MASQSHYYLWYRLIEKFAKTSSTAITKSFNILVHASWVMWGQKGIYESEVSKAKRCS